MTAATTVTIRPRPSRGPADLLDPTERLSDYGLSDPQVGLEACPGLLVVHADGTAECLQSTGCPTDPAMHGGLVSCGDVMPGCC